MTKLTIAAAALVLAVAAKAAEHPKEHPTGGMDQNTAPAAPATPATPAEPPKVGSKEWIKDMNKEYVKAVEDNVKAAKASGGFKVHDEKLNKDWALALEHVHKDRIAYLGNNTFFACADFHSTAAKDMTKVDLDFYATKTDAGWKVEKVLVHKINGKARYTYNMKNEMVPVKE